MHEYEIIVEDMTPCGGVKYARREVIEAEAESPEAWVKAHGRYALILDVSKNAKGDTVIKTGDGKGYITIYTFEE